MQFSQLDRQFDESLERLRVRGASIPNPYGTAPLAADHFLFKKSWDYFRARVRAIEDQWRKILQAKEAQIKTLTVELQEARERSIDLEDENYLLRSLDQNIKKARTEDFRGFAKKNENLRVRWDAERDALQRKIDEFEFRMSQAKKDFEKERGAAKNHEDALQTTILSLRKEISTHAERERDIQRQWSKQIEEQSEKILALENRADILSNEVERRDQLIKQLKESVAGHEKDAQALVQYVAELQRNLREKEIERGHLQTRLDILRQEKDTLRAAWQREQAEWRELWDRGRDAWERKK